MIFRNLTIYTITPGFKPNVEELEKQSFQPCGPSDMATRGWQVVRDDELMLNVNKHILLSLETETRLLPASVVAKAAKLRAQEIEEREGYKPGRKQMREIREQVQDELIPKAFTVQRKTAVWISPEKGLLCIDTASASRADEVLGLLLKSCEGIGIKRLVTKMSPALAMTSWLTSGDAPVLFNLDKDCELKGREHSAVKFTNEDVVSDAVLKQIQAGKSPSKVAMTYHDRVSFVLSEAGTICKIKLLDIVREQAVDAETASELFDAEFALMSGEFSQLIDAVVASLGGFRIDKE